MILPYLTLCSILLLNQITISSCFTTTIKSKRHTSPHSHEPYKQSKLYSSSNIEDEEKLKLLQQKLKVTQNLEKISQLELDVKNKKNEDVIVQDILALCNEMNIDFPPSVKVTTTSENEIDFDLESACNYFDTQLPTITKTVLAKLCNGYSTIEASNTKDIILNLYNNRARVFMEDTNIRKLINDEIIQSFQTNRYPANQLYQQSTKNTEVEDEFDLFSVEIDNDIEISDILSEDITEAKIRRFVESSLPKTTRKGSEFEPTKADADRFLSVLDSSNVFVPSSRQPEAIPGGFIIRGNAKNEMTGEDILNSTLETSFQSNALSKKYQYHYIKDPTPVALEDPNELFGSPVLLFISNDVKATTSPILLSLVSLASLFLILIFALGTFASNESVTTRLAEMNAIGDYNDDWLNDLLLPLLFGIAASQVLHEVGHGIVAKINDFRISLPTVLPSVYIPYLGCVTNIESSPKNLTSLFDFAILGPVFGTLSSLFFLNLGLELTLSADAAAYTYFPSLSLDYLHVSNLGYGIVQAYLGDSSLLSDVNGNVQLHPFAIAGFTTLFINALNLLPLGNTDGGRMSQAIFGRNGHTVVQGIIYITMLSTIFLSLDNANINSNIYLGYTIFCLLGQNDFEIPCRNEVDGVDFGRVVLAIAAWVFVALTITAV